MGFALARKVHNQTTVEEMWGPFDGFFGPEGELNSTDRHRAKEALEVFRSIKGEARLRAATDNHFANGVAHGLGLRLYNGMALSTRKLDKPIEISIPDGFNIRPYHGGDESNIKKMHDYFYGSGNPLSVYRNWVEKENCETFIAENNGKFAGHIIAEVRERGYGDFDIAVHEKYFRRGLGSALLREGMNSLLDRGVMTAIADYMTLNAVTNNFYLRNGFNLARTYNYFEIK